MALRPGLVEELVPVQTGWFADENVFDMQIERYRPHRSARRFDAGTPPVPNIYAGVAGVGLIAEAGVPAIQAHVRGLVERLTAGLDELGATVAAPPHGPLVCIRSTDAPALVDAVAEDGIVASERDSNLRVSLHLYNTDEDVDAVLASLAGNRALLA
jgi:selenocysteine lyase/cysteine desulfurase